jgi:hypothetical protein
VKEKTNMIETTKQPRRRPGAQKFTALAALALLALCLPGAASAQWTTPDAQGNINTTNTGKVGIGTTAPPHTVTIVKDQVGSTTLGVFNTTDAPGTVTAIGTGRLLDWSDKYFTFGVTPPSFGVPGLNDTGIMHTKGVTLKFGSESAHDVHFFTDGWNNTRMIISGAGNVGIGTTNPASAKLVVSSNAATPFAPQPGTILHLVNADSTKTRLNIDSFGLGGEPSVTFRSARGTAAAPTATQAGDRLAILHGTGFGATQFLFNAKPNITMQATESWSDTAAGSAITFSTVTNGTTMLAERLRINNDGYVGVGTAAPAARLHVAGDIRVDGNINAKYQDVAEWVPSTQKLAAGTVVTLDPERSNHVLASTASYDTAVAGVVSEKPGLTLGDAGEGKALVATTGRVKVRVDATRGAIRIGDLIVTSDVEGVAMKSEPVVVGGRRMHAPGTIIGKALEPLAAGTGEILVLLSLQ